MTKYKLMAAAAVLCMAAGADARAEEKSGKSDLRANFRRVALEMSSTEVKNADLYVDSPNSQLSADSKTMIKGVFDFVLEYEQPNWQWNNSLFMEYGRTKLKPVGEEDTTNEDADKILLTSDYNCKLWKLEFQNADAGPFASVAYQTEFTRNNDAPRMKVVRGKTGLKLFNGEYIKELYAAAVGEYDFTYSGDEVRKAPMNRDPGGTPHFRSGEISARRLFPQLCKLQQICGDGPEIRIERYRADGRENLSEVQPGTLCQLFSGKGAGRGQGRFQLPDRPFVCLFRFV